MAHLGMYLGSKTSLNNRMPYPPIYPGSQSDIVDQISQNNFFGNPDISVGRRDPFMNLLYNEPRSSGPPLLAYPVDLGQNPEYMFSIRFDIHETGGANLTQRRSIQDASYSGIREAARNAQGSLSFGQFTELVTSAGGAIADTISSAFGPTGSIANAANQGRGRDSFVEEATGLGNLTTPAGNIYMYLPGAISIGYSFEYEDADLSAMDILKGLRSLTETQTSAGGQAQAEIARKMGLAAVKVADDITELVGGKEGLTKMTAGSQRQVQNPFVVHMFKGVGRRTFKFSFTMIPRSQEESKSIDSIVRMFRRYAHPRRSEGGRFLDFPAEFNITFLYRNQEIIRIPKIRKCALKGINLTYGENTFTATKPDTNGMVSPTKIVMELEFSELELLVQQSVDDHGA
jgi:hypothetical protein